MQEQGSRIAMKRAFAYSFEWLEAITPVELDRLRFGVGYDTNAT